MIILLGARLEFGISTSPNRMQVSFEPLDHLPRWSMKLHLPASSGVAVPKFSLERENLMYQTQMIYQHIIFMCRVIIRKIIMLVPIDSLPYSILLYAQPDIQCFPKMNSRNHKFDTFWSLEKSWNPEPASTLQSLLLGKM